MNIEVIWCVVTLILLCFIGAVGSGLWVESLDGFLVPFLIIFGDKPCCEGGADSSFQGFLTFWTFVIILQVKCYYERCCDSVVYLAKSAVSHRRKVSRFSIISFFYIR